MPRTRARLIAAGVALVGLLAGATGVAGMWPSAHATPVVGVYRFAGANRYGTAQLIGDYKVQGSSSFAFGAPTSAIIASGDNFPDALSSNFLAGTASAPIFLTAQNTLRQEAVTGLQALGVKKVTIVGGTSAVAPTEDLLLTADGFVVTRVSGSDRDGTAAAVATAGAAAIGNYNSEGLTAILANDSSDHYVDALTAGPMSWAGHFPILLTGANALSPETGGALTALKIKHVIIVGGTAAISPAVQSAVETLGITVERLAGTDRQLTATAIAAAEQGHLGFGNNAYGLAVGNNFPDALAGGPLGGLDKAPILLTSDPNALSPDTQAFLSGLNSVVNELLVFGGQAALSDAVVTQAVGVSTCASGTPGTTTSTVGVTTPTLAATTTTAGGGTTTTTAGGGTTTTAAPTTTSTAAPATTTTGALSACSTTTTSAPTTSTTGAPATTTSTTVAATTTTA